MQAENKQDNATPILTVGMPVYNGARWLEKSLESILSQSFSDFELFIADNASLDDTESICRQYAEKDSRVRYHRHAYNRGALKNYNDVFLMTDSKYFKWASCSDLCKPTLFQRCIEILEAREEVALAYAQTMLFSSISGEERLFYQNLTLEADAPSERFGLALDWLEGLNNAYNGVFRRSVLNNLMPYKESRSYDINFMFEVALYGKFIEVYEPLFYRRYDIESTGTLLDQGSQASFFGAESMRVGRLQRFFRQLDIFAIPFRTPVPFSEKIRIERDLFGRLMWRVPENIRSIIQLSKRAWKKIAQ